MPSLYSLTKGKAAIVALGRAMRDFIARDGRSSSHMPPLYQRSVTFEPEKLSEGRWNVCVRTPGGETLHITGFSTELEAETWLASSERTEWLRQQGWERWDIDD